MTGRTRLAVAGGFLLAVLAALLTLAFAISACPASLPGQPCPNAAANRVAAVALGALTVGLLVTPFAFLAEYAVRRRIVYRGAWARAVRRGGLVAAAVGALAGLRLGDALSVPAALFAISLAAAAEWFATRRIDAP